MKKPFFRSVVAVLAFLVSSVAFSEEIPERYGYKRHSFEVGPEFSYRRYKESGVMEEKGWMYGAQGSYAFHNGIMFKADARSNSGDMTYEGSFSDGTPVKQSNIYDFLFETRALIGYDFPIWKRTLLTYFAGFGYRYLNDDSSDYVGGYERESNYYYSPLGMTFSTNLGNGWAISETLEYDVFWHGKQFSRLSDADPSLPDISNKQESGYGYKASIKVEKKLGRVILEAAAFIDRWSIDQSEYEIRFIGGDPYLFWEPKNNTLETGIFVGAKF